MAGACSREDVLTSLPGSQREKKGTEFTVPFEAHPQQPNFSQQQKASLYLTSGLAHSVGVIDTVHTGLIFIP